ncbi:MAG: hypothetical protein OXH97_03230 [Chloroflexota bacterium]|nr:hypothetical protein [Chloroflexota bacterium]
MNDEGIGIAGWLLADLVLVLAIVFLAFTPPARSDEPAAVAAPTLEATVAPPLILDIGCFAAGTGGRTDVECEPTLGGGGDVEYEWEPDGGQARSRDDRDSFAASFTVAGAVRLTVTNTGGRHSAEFFVRPSPTPTATPADETTNEDCTQVRTDFRFAQIVLTGARYGDVEWEDIARTRVRENLIKSKEDDPAREIDDAEWLNTGAETFLRRKHREGFRIALVETFSHAPEDSQAGASDPHIRLSGQVNDVFVEELNRLGIDIFVDRDAARQNWFADYRDKSLRIGEVRINLYFVKPFDDEDCQ